MYEVLKTDNDYEILNKEPYTIRRIRNKKVVNRILNKDGYTVVSLNSRNRYIHKVLAEQFIDNPNNYKHVRFKDGNPSNFSLDNLEWADRKTINKHLKRVTKKTNEELKQLDRTEGLSRPQIRRWNKLHGIKDYVEVKYSECDSKEFEGFLGEVNK